MPHTASLHIDAHEGDPDRVVDLPGRSARIGRAAFCDIRLAEPSIANEVARIGYRGGSWQIIPLGRQTTVWLDGEPLDGPRELPFDVPFRIGDYRLTLRQALEPTVPVATWTARGERLVSAHESAATVEPLIAPTPIESPGSELAARHRNEWESGAVVHSRLNHNQREVKRWESRMKAVGERLRTSSVAAPAVPQARIPSAVIRRPTIPREPESRRPEALPVKTPRILRADRETLARTSWRDQPMPRPVKPAPPAMKPETARSKLTSPPFLASSSEQDRILLSLPAPTYFEAKDAEDMSASRKVELREPAQGLKEEADSTREAVIENGHDDADFLEPESVLSTVEPRGEEGDLAPESSYLGALSRNNEIRETYLHQQTQDSEIRADPIESRLSFAETDDFAREVEAIAFRAEPDWVGGPEDSWVAATRFEDHEPEIVASPADEEPLVDRTIETMRSRVDEAAPLEVETSVVPVQEPEVPPSSSAVDNQEIAEPRPTRSRKLGAAVRARPPEPEVFSEVWTDDGSFDTRTFLGHGAVVDLPEPIVHATDSRSQGAFAGADHDPGRYVTIPPEGGIRDLPSVSDILAAQGERARAGSVDRTALKSSSRPSPTILIEPACWTLPLWLGWTPLAAAALLIGAAGFLAAWTWARDDYNAGIVFARLADPSGKPEPLPEGVVPTGGSWWRSHASNLVGWAAFLDQARGGGEIDQRGEARALLERAAQASPLDPSVRRARAVMPAEGETDVPLARVLGQSRDVLTMSAAGGRLLLEGKKKEALEAYRLALAMAAHPDPSQAEAPTFLDDPDTARYGLPGEDLLGPVIRDMASSKAWTYPEWVDALPADPVVRVVVARVLRASGSEFAREALEVALIEPPADPALSSAETAARMAAAGEALAIQGSWAEARERYRQAITLTPIDVVRRAWWLNVAVFSLKLNEESERLKALEAAKNPDPRDEVTQRVVEIQKKMGYVARRANASDSSLREGKTPGPALK